MSSDRPWLRPYVVNTPFFRRQSPPPVGTDPQRAITRFIDGNDPVLRQAIGLAEVAEPAVAKLVQPATVGPHPEVARRGPRDGLVGPRSEPSGSSRYRVRRISVA